MLSCLNCRGYLPQQTSRVCKNCLIDLTISLSPKPDGDFTTTRLSSGVLDSIKSAQTILSDFKEFSHKILSVEEITRLLSVNDMINEELARLKIPENSVLSPALKISEVEISKLLANLNDSDANLINILSEVSKNIGKTISLSHRRMRQGYATFHSSTQSAVLDIPSKESSSISSDEEDIFVLEEINHNLPDFIKHHQFQELKKLMASFGGADDECELIIKHLSDLTKGIQRIQTNTFNPQKKLITLSKELKQITKDFSDSVEDIIEELDQNGFDNIEKIHTDLKNIQEQVDGLIRDRVQASYNSIRRATTI